MNPPLALFFSIVGIMLLAGIGISLSYGSPWLVLFFSAAALFFIGYGFILKARLRRKAEAGKKPE